MLLNKLLLLDHYHGRFAGYVQLFQESEKIWYISIKFLPLRMITLNFFCLGQQIPVGQ